MPVAEGTSLSGDGRSRQKREENDGGNIQLHGNDRVGLGIESNRRVFYTRN